MKRRFTGFAFAVAACFMVTGCGSNSNKTAKNQLNTPFTTGVTMELEDLTAEGTIQRSGSGTWNISFTEPSQLAGVRLDFQDGEVTASYKGLEFSVPQTALPAKSIMHHFITVTDQLAEASSLQGTTEENGVALTGELEAGNYTLLLQEDGNPAEFRMENLNAVMLFHDFTPSAAVVTDIATETTTADTTMVTTTISAVSE